MTYLYTSVILFVIALACGVITFTSQMRLWKKVVVILALSFSGMITYRAMNDMQGWSALLQKDLKKVTILGHYPDKKNKVIHIWVIDPDASKPRTYTIPFNPKTAKMFDQMRRQHRGKPYKLNIKVKTNELNRFQNKVEKVEISPYTWDQYRKN